MNGRVVEPANLERLRISRSEEPSSVIVERIKASDRQSSVAMLGGPSYSWRAASQAEDVTDEFIVGPPGHDAGEAAAEADDAKVRRVTVPAGPGDGRTACHKRATLGGRTGVDRGYWWTVVTPSDLGIRRIGSGHGCPRPVSQAEERDLGFSSTARGCVPIRASGRPSGCLVVSGMNQACPWFSCRAAHHR